MSLYGAGVALGREWATQSILQQLGYYEGRPDGWHGPKTQAALRAFQDEHPTLDVTGELNERTWGWLLAAIDCVSEDVRRAEYADAFPGGWAPVDRDLFVAFLRYCQAHVQMRVSYGPGCYHHDDPDGPMGQIKPRQIVCIGANGPGKRRYKSLDKLPAPSAVCSSFLYAAACWLLREGAAYNLYRRGAQPPCWEWLLGPDGYVKGGGGFGPYIRYGSHFARVQSNGSSAVRDKRTAKGRDLDLLEVWDRLDDLPEVMFCAQAPASRGFICHCAILLIDRINRVIYRFAADGGKSGGVFSGRDMTQGQIRSREEAAAAAKGGGWYRPYGLVPGQVLDRRLATREPLGLAFEVEPFKFVDFDLDRMAPVAGV